MNRIFAFMLGAAFVASLAGCTSLSTGADNAEIVYAAASALDVAEKAAVIYEKSSLANPSVVAQIKTLDSQASSVIDPLVAAAASSPNSITALEATEAQDAVTALTTYLTANGVK